MSKREVDNKLLDETIKDMEALWEYVHTLPKDQWKVTAKSHQRFDQLVERFNSYLRSDSDESIEELTNDLQRLQADFINFRRRSEEEKANIISFLEQDVVLKFLPVRDNIERALIDLEKWYIPENVDVKDFRLGLKAYKEGLINIAKQFDKILSGFGIEKIQSIGQPFDPNLHEAITADDSGEHEIVVEELLSGYRCGDKVIRHSVVKVGRSKSTLSSESKQEGD